ncbi:MAG TPA: hypothetical protein VGR45_08620 [Stellaceae bacterium]|nr:hypothetical protein [Stellaceae bacterium]
MVNFWRMSWSERGTLKIAISGVMISATVVSCAPMVWDKPGATQAEFNQDSDKCRLVARGMNPGDFYAQGSPTAALGNAIGTAVGQRQTYQDCMMAGGYALEQSQERAVVARSIRPIATQLLACVRGVYYAPDADAIRSRVPFDPMGASPEQLSDPSTVTTEQVVAIGSLHPHLRACRQQALAQLSTAAPAVVSVLANAYQRSDDLVAQLRDGKISWGSFNTTRESQEVAVKEELQAALSENTASR